MNPSIALRHSNRRLTQRLTVIVSLAALLASGLLATAVPPPGRAAEDPNWTGQYFANQDLAGAPVLTRDDAQISFDWGAGSPDPAIGIDQYSVRWTRTITATAGTYRFTTITDDGVRLYVDGQLVIDHWVGQAPTEYQADVPLTAGDHEIVMEYFEAFGDAVAVLTYGVIQAEIPPGSWRGEYFANQTLSGSPAVIRADPTIAFDWGPGAPHPGIPADKFSVRWTRTLSLSGGVYRFATTTDDGVRLWVNNQLLIDQWLPQPSTYHEADITLASGNHAVRVEYFEAFGDASAHVSWALRGTGGVVRLNSGGSGYADSHNNFWEPDANATGGLVSEETQPIWNTVDDPLYVNERAGAFSYNIPVSNGSHIVRLHFAELFFASAGVRRFDVTIEGQKRMTSFDIYGEARKAALVTKSFTTSVTDGILTIQFSKVFDNASIQAIDVYPAATSADLVAPTFAPIPEPENTTYTTSPTVSLSIADDRGLNDGYWRINDDVPQPLFEANTGAGHSGQFTLPIEVFNALPLGSHVLSIGVNDDYGNASVQTWRFRKLLSGSGSAPIAFDRRAVATVSTPGMSLLKNPTTLDLGPDGRLYVGQQNGYVHALTLDANRNVTAVQRINTIFTTPNTNPDGSAASVQGRTLLGIAFDPASTPERPILWMAHSDPRFCFNKSPETCAVNTNSGILTRLVGPDFDNPANRTDVVTGLPRSRELHAPNAVHFGPDGWLYLTTGSDTNYGAPSSAFSGLSERFLTAAMLRINVNGAAASFPRDVRHIDTNGELVPGVFEVYATGYRNAFDFAWHSNGTLYLNGNAGNFTAGTTPGPEHGCPNGVAFDPGTRNDYLTIVTQGAHGGHPAPIRGKCILDDGTMYSPAKAPDIGYRAPLLHYQNGTSSNGMVEYKAATFGGQMLGNLISATYAGNQSVRRVVLANDGQSVLFEEDLAIFSQPLDVEVTSDGAIFVAEHGANTVQIMEPATALAGSWDFKASMPTPVQELGVVACNGLVYALGGLVGPGQNTNALSIYNPAGDTWSAGAPYPGTAVDHPGAACVNGKVYMLGGLIGAGTAVNTVREYDPATNAWTLKANMPWARGAMGVAAYAGEIYVAGGLGYPAKNDAGAYNPVTNTWRLLAPMPTARDHLIMEEIGGKLYAIGGRNVTLDTVLATNQVYDPATNTWATRAPMPVARAAMASGTLHGRIQVWGGEGPSGTPTSTYPQGHEYDASTNAWIQIADQPTPRHGTDGATIGDVIYIPGGGPQQGNSVTDVQEAFSFISTDPPESCIDPLDDPRTTDSDGDGYTDEDEGLNGTDPCSASSQPVDNDGDDLSDLMDPDDDNDGVNDVADQYQLDPANGTATALPFIINWNPGDEPAGFYGNSGFPGVQLTTNGVGFIAPNVHPGGAGGFLGLAATAGTNRENINSQDNALQVGFNATQPFTISTRLTDPFAGQIVEPGKIGGIFLGRDEETYVSLGVTGDTGAGSPGFTFAVETDGTYVANPSGTPVNLAMPGPANVDLMLSVDPAAGSITALYRVDSDQASSIVTIGTVSTAQFPGLTDLFVVGAGAGVTTTNQTGSTFGLAYDYFRIDPGTTQGGGGPTPTPTPIGTATPTPVITPTPTPIATATPSPTPTPVSTPGALPEGTYIETGGTVVIEAEHFTGRVDRNSQSWVERTNRAGFVGSGFMVTEPNAPLINSGFATTSPELQYDVSFATTGTYDVWVRGLAANGSSDTVHVGLDGAAVATADRMELGTKNAFTWFDQTMDGPVATLTITSPGVHRINVWMRESGFRLDRMLLTRTTTLVPTGDGPAESSRSDGSGVPATPTPTPAPTVSPGSVPAGTFLSAGGTVVMEAEHFTDRVNRNGQSWVERTNQAGFVGSGFMVAEPNAPVINAGFATTSPEIQFRVFLDAPGTYHVWLRGLATNGSNDSVHVGLDGAAVSTADRMSLNTTGAFTWFKTTMDGPVATIQVATGGLHVVNVWSRESGFRLDRLLLTRDAAFTPTGSGPPESTRSSAGAAALPPAATGGSVVPPTAAALVEVLFVLLVLSLVVLLSRRGRPSASSGGSWGATRANRRSPRLASG